MHQAIKENSHLPIANCIYKASDSSGVGMTKETYYERKKGKKLKFMINCS